MIGNVEVDKYKILRKRKEKIFRRENWLMHVMKLIYIKDTLKAYFGNRIHSSTLWLWVGYFIYFKFTPAFFK